MTTPLSDLIILACLIANPDQCERTVMRTPQTVAECHTARPLILAQWRRERPEMRVRQIKCRPHMADA